MPLKILLMFSAIGNMRRLLKTSGDDNNPLHFLSGFKFFLISWVVYAHSYIIIRVEFADNLLSLIDILSQAQSQMITNGTMSVSTFLFLSGFILPFMTCGSRASMKNKNLFFAYLGGILERYIRITIPALVVMMSAFLLPLLMDGPADYDVANQIRNCEERPWVVAAHVNNFMPMHLVCLPHLWYISADMQIFVAIALPLALMFSRYPRLAFPIAWTLAIGFCVFTCVQIHSWDLVYSLTVGTNNLRQSLESMEFIYFRPYVHAASYVFGIVTGHFSVKHNTAKISRVTQVAQWLASIGLASFVMFITVPWNKGNLPNSIVNVLYGGFHRLLWSIALIWPCYACATGRGGLLNKFFCWKAFRPLSRLTYSVYLIHIFFFFLRSGNLKTNFELGEYFQLSVSMGVFGFALFFGLILHLCVEAPVSHLQKLIFRGSPTPTETTELKSSCENGEQKSQL
ncbi:unnamed protein product [Ixodes hexagonus]